MKNTKLLFCMMLGLGLVLCPGFVNARTEAEAKAIMDDLPIVEDGEGNCTFNANTIPYDEMKEYVCGFTYEEYVKRHPYKDTYNQTQLEEAFNQDLTYCTSNFLDRMFSHISNDAYFTYDEDQELLNISVNYDGGNLNKTCTVKYAEYDEEIVDAAKNVDNKLDYTYTLYGYDVINSFYHYGGLESDIWKNNNVMYRFPRIKEVLMDYPEFDYETSAGGSVGGFHSQASGFIKMFKDNVLYGMHYFSTNYFAILLVDKDEEGTTLEKAKRSLNNYFGDKVEYRFDEDNVFGIDDSGFDLANKAFGTTGVTYDGIDVMFFIGDEQFNIGVAEMDKEAIKEFEVRAKDKTTGVHVHTNSYDVPVDATLEVEDVTDEMDSVFDNKMFKVHSAYDIDVVKMANGGFVKKIENGIDVYLPVTGKKVGDKLTVYHVTDNEKGEGFKGIVVEVDGKQYVKFRTTHFSTYAVVETLSETGDNAGQDEITNPNTSDNIISLVMLFIGSIVTLSGIVLLKKNN